MAWRPRPGWRELRGIIEVGTREACSHPPAFPTPTPPHDLGGLASCPELRFSRAVDLVGGRAGFPPSQSQNLGFYRDEPAI